MYKGFSEERKGELIILAEAFLWSLFPVITILSFKNVSPILSLAWTVLFSAFFFGIVLCVKGGWRDLGNKKALGDILLATGILGIIYYLLFFFGLRYTSAGNASIIALTEVFFSFLFFNVLRKEYFSFQYGVGAVLVLVGAIIVLYPNVHEFRIGDILILLASFIAPLGNFFQRRARKQVRSEALLFIRSLISAIFMFALVYFLKIDSSAIDIKDSFAILIINGFFLLGLSKLLWVEGIHRISVAKANALSGTTPLLTLLFAWILLGNVPTWFQLFAFVPMFFGVLFLSGNEKYILFWKRVQLK